MSQAQGAAQQLLDRDRFCALWDRNRASAQGPAAAAIWAYLMEQFRQPHRHYHDHKHIAHCLAELDAARNEIGNPDMVELALWFHDAIYEPGDRNNELRSAELFLSYAQTALPATLAKEIYDAILVTVHQRQPERNNARFVVDIDLSSFGLPWPEFMADCHALRKEQVNVPDSEFYPGKRKFLYHLIERSSIFATPSFRQRYEDAARINIERYLGLIGKQGALLQE
ncbi:MAG TPA: hypothetical protein VFV18_03155 [Porticoccaceae bacterium]|nr:hypothetical protein [Porticoccaceae bacterium]